MKLLSIIQPCFISAVILRCDEEGLPDKATIRREVEKWAYASARSLESDPKMAEKQALNAKKLRLRSRVRSPYELKLLFCKKCKEFSPPPKYSTIRIRNGWLVIRCSRCGGIYRKKLVPLPSRKRK
jgi:ribonuclease P protein subunit RPR2